MTDSRSDDVSAPRVPLSILDLAIVPEGGSGAQAIRDVIDLSAAAEDLGYRRIWFAEHHLAAGVASAAPAVLAALAAERTTRIRIGSGAIALSATSPLQAVEQFGTIAALHPGRTDLGLGRAFVLPPKNETPDGGAPEREHAAVPAWRRRSTHTPARDVDGLHVPATPAGGADDDGFRKRLARRVALIGRSRTPESFRAEVDLVLGLRAGEHVGPPTAPGEGATVSPPAAGADFEVWVLASSGGESARVAGELGLPLAANYHVSPSSILATVAAYRDAFRPGVLSEPYVLVSVDALVADTDAHARELAEPFVDWVLSVRRTAGGAVAFPRPGTTTPWADRDPAEQALVRDRIDARFVGSPATVVERLEALVRVTGADEVLVTTATHDPADRLRSFGLLAQAWGQPPDIRVGSSSASVTSSR
ncbi:LLM class flavin-dependent oxidoreductase [Occultella aeris]|uniref:Limonene 1,2-monooxygenase n=1 Tax=Occultella aeris TaxID=2761496 RepID=A0A7M4DFP1_9MICO|nr:Limonene 1,2-monooxygenase [Occultella aeris]